jgi:hypothetical protein
MAREAGDVVATYPATGNPEPVTHVRGMLLASGLGIVRERRLTDRYYSLLSPEHAVAVSAIVANDWVPLDTTLAHYAAMNELFPSPDEQVANGRQVAARVNASILGTVISLTHAGGATPWTLLKPLPRVIGRLLQGGGLVVRRLGPKESLNTFLELPLARVPYFCSGLRGMFVAGTELVSRKAYCTEVRSLCTSTTYAFRVSWV